MQPFDFASSASIYDIAGVAGFLGYVLAYSCLTFQILTSRHIRYFALNLVSSSLVLFSLIGSFNLATLMIQLFFVTASIIAIWSRVQIRRRERKAALLSFHTLRERSTARPRPRRTEKPVSQVFPFAV